MGHGKQLVGTFSCSVSFRDDEEGMEQAQFGWWAHCFRMFEETETSVWMIEMVPTLDSQFDIQWSLVF